MDGKREAERNVWQNGQGSLGITKEYNKANRDALWDSAKGKAEYRDKMFGEKQTYADPVSGKTLHRSQTAAQNKYHMKNSEGVHVSSKWAEHSAEVDHINALKDVHKKVKNNPFLTDDDFKNIMNSDENYRILSKSDNIAKGAKNDWQVILDKSNGMSAGGRVQMAKQKVKADAVINSRFASKTAENAGREFISGSKDMLIDSAIPLTAEAVRRMVHVVQGDESLEDAAKGMAKTTVDIAVAGGSKRLIADVLSASLEANRSAAVQSVLNSSHLSQILSAAMIVKESAVRYINGEINETEFFEEIGEKGTSMVAGMIGGQVGREIGEFVGSIIGTAAIPIPGIGTAAGYAVGGVVGEVLGVIITTAACSAIVSVFHTSKNLDQYRLKEAQISRLEKEALREMEYQRKKFADIVQREYQVWDKTIQSSFDQILLCACEETYDLQGVTEGLDRILSIFGKKVRFNSLDEYEAQLDQTLTLSF